MKLFFEKRKELHSYRHFYAPFCRYPYNLKDNGTNLLNFNIDMLIFLNKAMKISHFN